VIAKHLLHFYHDQNDADVLQHHFGDSTGIKDVFQDYVNWAEFLSSFGDLPPHIG